VETLVQQARLLPPQSDWEVIGISDDQWRMVAAAIALVGNVRVGLEDNFYVVPGTMAGSNGELVEKAARMVRDQGRQVATIEECRARLGLVHV
jgi:3-keto-5-aminohexanoate cleavage enzyme